jgi:hypothetical protein
MDAHQHGAKSINDTEAGATEQGGGTQAEAIDTPPSLLGASIYANYASKLAQRYASYDYSRFPGAAQVYDSLLIALQDYEDGDRGRLAIVHGDPVLSNILMECGAELRFIDMRGKQGNVTTIFGDMWYDFAKIFQSLSGYDEVLLDRRVSSAYRERMLATFEEEITTAHGAEAMANVRLLAASLFFTLIPLHDNDKCEDYFEKARGLVADAQIGQARNPEAKNLFSVDASAF